MRSTPPGAPFTISDLQLSSPLPSPNRQNSNNNDNNTHHQQRHHHHHNHSTLNPASNPTTDNDNTISLYFEPPTHILSSELYPLTNLDTPNELKKFTFNMNGKSVLFEEIQSTIVRKRSASTWDDERSHKRTELSSSTPTEEELLTLNNDANGDHALQSPSITTSNTYTPGPSSEIVTTATTTTDIIPDSPNSALPSPVSDLDDPDDQEQQLQLWSSYATDEQEQQELQQLTIVDSNVLQQQQQYPSALIDFFEQLPTNVQSYFMFQLLKRSPRDALRLANESILEALKKDILLDLPRPIAHQILGYLDIRALCRATLVSRGWNALIEDASDVWQLKMTESSFKPSPKELDVDYKEIVRRHTIMRRNWNLNLHHKMLLDGHEDDLVTCLQFDDDKIITGSDDHSINIYDITTGELRRVLRGHEGGVWALQYVGNTLVTGSIDRTVRVWDIERGVCRFILRGHSSTVRCLKIVMPSEITHPDGSVTIEPSEPIIVSGSRDMTIRVWRLPDLEREPEIGLSTCLEDDVVSRRFLKFRLAEHEHSVRDLAVHGNTLVSGSYDNNVIVWDLETGRKVHVLKGHTMKVYCVTIDKKRRHCISGSLDASVRIWGLDDGECKFILQGHAILVGLIGLMDDYLVSAAADSTLRIWNPATGERLRILAGDNGHPGPITSFQHDKYKVISGSEGGVKMWDTQTGELMYNLIEDVAGVWRVCFDERRCIAAVKNEHKTQLIVLDFGIHNLEREYNT